MDDFATVMKFMLNSLKSIKPARSTVAVKTLPLNVKVEIDSIALIG